MAFCNVFDYDNHLIVLVLDLVAITFVFRLLTPDIVVLIFLDIIQRYESRAAIMPDRILDRFAGTPQGVAPIDHVVCAASSDWLK